MLGFDGLSNVFYRELALCASTGANPELSRSKLICREAGGGGVNCNGSV